ncbi:MAG: hypothetical protein EBQ76_01270 [Betaproteobacteria bacterium]|nr:hypothetical protein [Betaproteobacteria bacterium]
MAVWSLAKRSAVFSLLIGPLLAGCASHSTTAALQLDTKNPKYATPECQAQLDATGIHDGIRSGRTIGGAGLVILSGGLLAIPVLAANVGLDAYDHRDANLIARYCGGQEKSAEQIASEVGTSAALGIATGQLGVGASSAAGATLRSTTNK